MKWILSVILVAFTVPLQAQLTAEEILGRADEIRMPTGDYRIEVQTVSSKPGRPDQIGSYEVFLKGHAKTVIKTLAPATDRGTSFLMLGTDLWVFIQNVSKPIRISMRERLQGEIANGDLARANFVGDYTPTILAVQSHLYILRLDAIRPDVTYGRVELAIDRVSFRPLRAKFYAESGKLLKTGDYTDYRSMAGALRPSRLVYTDAVQTDHVSVLKYKSMSARTDLPDKMFAKDYLKKLKY